MRTTIMILLVLVGCAPAEPEPCDPVNPCEVIRPAYNEALARINAPGLDCSPDGFEAFGCLLFDPLTPAQLDACEAAFADLDGSSSCATLQNTLWTCEGGT
jgi:hypothetical protein